MGRVAAKAVRLYSTQAELDALNAAQAAVLRKVVDDLRSARRRKSWATIEVVEGDLVELAAGLDALARRKGDDDG